MTHVKTATGLDDGSPPTGRAELTNMALALGVIVDCMDAGENSPRMGLFYGFSGYGKTTGAAFAASSTGAAYVVAKSVWSQRSLLEAIATELGITRHARTGPKLLQQIIDEFCRAPRPLIIDEMDHLVRKQMVEIIRDIHDATAIAVMMIGEEALPVRLQEWERFDNRILVAVPAQPATADDALKLRDHYCRNVHVADDLALYFAERCKGVTRRIVVNLRAAQRLAAQVDREHIDRAWFGNRPVMNGEVITRRSHGVRS